MVADSMLFTLSETRAQARSQGGSSSRLGRHGPLSGVPLCRQMESSLYILSHVGLIISLLCLAVAIATFLLCRAIRNHNTYLHLHLCVCLFLAESLFLTGADKTDNQVSPPAGCAPPSQLRCLPTRLCLSLRLPAELPLGDF